MSTSTVVPNRPVWLAGLALVAALVWLAASSWSTDSAANRVAAIATPGVAAPPKIPPAMTNPADGGAKAATPPPKMMVDIARVVPRRASTAERADYRRRLDHAVDLVELAAALEVQAQTGDADAAAILAELLSQCTDLLSYAPRPARTDRVGGQPRPVPKDPRALRCAGFGPPGELTGFNLRSSAQAWTATAARLGHPASILAERRRKPTSWDAPVDESELLVRAAAEELLRAGEFAVLTNHATVLGQLSHDRMQPAWLITLCEMAAPCDRRKRNCGYACDPARQAQELQQMSPRQRREMAGQQLQILQALQSGRFDELWRRSSDAGGRP